MQEQTQAVRLLTNLLGIYSPSGKEQDIANFLALEMKKMGFQVGIDAIGNVIGVVGEGEPTIFLCGHMDTVAGHLAAACGRRQNLRPRRRRRQRTPRRNGYGSRRSSPRNPRLRAKAKFSSPASSKKKPPAAASNTSSRRASKQTTPYSANPAASKT